MLYKVILTWQSNDDYALKLNKK